MNPWVRLGVILVLAVAATLFLKILPPVIVLVFFVGAVGAVNVTLRGRARRELARGTEASLGLRRESRDPFGLLGYPLALFGRGTEGRIDDLSWGTWNGLEVKRFEYSWDQPTGSERGRFSCAMAPLGASCPPLVVEPRTMGLALSEVPMQSVTLGSERFDTAYVVRTKDPAFARSLIDPPMREWLETLGDPWGFEVRGSLAVAYGPPTVQAVEVLDRLRAFLALAPASPGELDVPEQPAAG